MCSSDLSGSAEPGRSGSAEPPESLEAANAQRAITITASLAPGYTLGEALAFELAQKIAALTEHGKGRSALAAIDLFAAACRALARFDVRAELGLGDLHLVAGQMGPRQAPPDQEQSSESEDERLASYFFVLSHGFETPESPGPSRVH